MKGSILGAISLHFAGPYQGLKIMGRVSSAAAPLRAQPCFLLDILNLVFLYRDSSGLTFVTL